MYYTATDGNPASIREVRDHIDFQRASLFLDGPNGFDWVFPRSITSARDDALYVDYVELDDQFLWTYPHVRWPDKWRATAPFRLVRALLSAGLGTAKGLEAVNDVWASFRVELPEEVHMSVITSSRDTT